MYRSDIAIARKCNVFFFQGYDPKVAAFIEYVLRAIRSATAFDIGANLSGHTLVNGMPSRRSPCFRTARAPCEAHRRVGRQPLGTHAHRFGLGEQVNRSAYFLNETSHDRGTGSFIAEHASSPRVAPLLLRRGDNWSASRKVDFIKIDVEGY